MTSYRIRQARKRELRRLQDIENTAGELFAASPYPALVDWPPRPLDLLAEAQQHQRLWVACDQAGKPVGFALVQPVDDGAHLHELAVHPAHGRRGLGSRLVQAVCRWARRKGLAGVTLFTFSDVPWNAPYYQRQGFRIISEHELGPQLRRHRAEEAANGMPMQHRVCMFMAV